MQKRIEFISKNLQNLGLERQTGVPHRPLESQTGVPHRPLASQPGVPHRPLVVLDLGTLLGASWEPVAAVLEGFWAVLGRERLPTWFQVGPQNGAKINQKSIPKSIIFLMPLGIDFWVDLN